MRLSFPTIRLVVILVLLAGGGPASAQGDGEGTLVFRPEAPVAGQDVEVLYRPLPALAGEARLHLRARLRTPSDDPYNQGMGSRTVAVLLPDEGGTYRGRFTLPAGTVYAAFAVEDPGATTVDTRRDRFWELLVHDEDGRPLFAALEQRFNDHMGRDQLDVLETARQMTRLYPDHPPAWTSLRAAESWVLGEEGAQEREAAHRDRALAFDEAFRARDDLAADEVGYLYWYGEGEIRERWRARLRADFPGHFFAVQERAMELRRDLGEKPDTLLDELARLWEVAADGEARSRVVGVAFGVARGSGNREATLLWADRWAESSPSGTQTVALALATTESTRNEGIRRLKVEIEETLEAPDEDRALGATAEEYAATTARVVATQRQYLGEALVEAGRVREGIHALAMAAAEGWSPARFRDLGQAYLVAGDTAEAVECFAALAADPGMTNAQTDSLRAAAGTEPRVWDEALREAREEMVRRTLAEAREDPLPPVHVSAPEGSTHALADLLGEEATLVVFWSRYCGYSNRAMPRIVALAGRLREEGIPVLAVTHDPSDEASAYLAENGWADGPLTILLDADSEAAMAFDNWGTPAYYLVDGSGRLRFRSSLESVPRQIAALRSTAADAEER